MKREAVEESKSAVAESEASATERSARCPNGRKQTRNNLQMNEARETKWSGLVVNECRGS